MTGRWARSRFYAQDYIRLWTRGGGNSFQYTHWIHEAILQQAKVTGDLSFATAQLDGMISMWNVWMDNVFDSQIGLFYYTPVFDAMEYSLPGYVDGDPSLQFAGPNTFRPSHNAYMYANALAIAEIAHIAGRSDVVQNFTNIANRLQQAFYSQLWNSSVSFFVDSIRRGPGQADKLSGREEVGAFPQRFGLGLEPQYANGTIAGLFDTQGLLSQYGPRTLEGRNQYYTAEKPTGYCCYWQGQSWPFSTAQVVDSLASMYRSGSVNADQYYQYLSIYTATQYKNGFPYVAESHYPEMNSWSADSTNHSEHYDHSTYVDNVITGLLGVVPQTNNTLMIYPIIPSNWTYFAIENLPYHGHLLTILYDQTGTKYNQGVGLTVFVDGVQTQQANTTKAIVNINTGTLPSSPSVVNIAANPGPVGTFPVANASYTYNLDAPFKAFDGALFYDPTPDNRWTNYQSPSSSDTLQVTFARPRTFSSVTLAFYQDTGTGGAVACPANISIVTSAGPVNNMSPFKCIPNARNTFSFDAVNATYVAVTMTGDAGHAVGVCEMEVWVPANTGPLYEAEDGLVQNQESTKSDPSASSGVYTSLNSTQTLLIGGVVASASADHNVALRYRAASDSSILLQVNYLANYTFNLAAASNWTTANATVGLLQGLNTLLLQQPSGPIDVDYIVVS